MKNEQTMMICRAIVRGTHSLRLADMIPFERAIIRRVASGDASPEAVGAARETFRAHHEIMSEIAAFGRA